MYSVFMSAHLQTAPYMEVTIIKEVLDSLAVYKCNRMYSRFPHARNHFFSLLFLNSNILLNLLFYMIMQTCFLCKGVSYMWKPTVFEFSC